MDAPDNGHTGPMSGHRLLSCLVLVAALVGPAPAMAATLEPDVHWTGRIAAASKVAQSRSGTIGFAVVDHRGVVVGGYRARRVLHSASVFKSMLLICYLNDPAVRGRSLTVWERSQLRAMITRSADDPANWLYGRVSHACLRRLAHDTGMGRTFHTEPVWGRTTITPHGIARMFWNIDRRIVARHRPYAMRLLRGVVPSQRWGLARVVPSGMTIAFKGGFAWSPGGGRIVSQGALLTAANGHRIAIAVLTNHSPSQAYGERTLQLIGDRLLRGYQPVPPVAAG